MLSACVLGEHSCNVKTGGRDFCLAQLNCYRWTNAVAERRGRPEPAGHLAESDRPGGSGQGNDALAHIFVNAIFIAVRSSISSGREEHGQNTGDSFKAFILIIRL